MSAVDEPGRPVLRVIRGDATPEEIAALLAVVAAKAAGGTGEAPAVVPDAWSDRAALMRRPVSAGPGAWRASAWTR